MKEKEKMAFDFEFKDHVQMKGILRYKVFKAGILVEDVEDNNLIVNTGRDLMTHLLAGEFTGKNITQIAFGENPDMSAMTDTEIILPFFKDISDFVFPGVGRVQFNWGLETTEANGKSIFEFGLISGNGTLFSRRIRKNGKALNKEDDISIIGQWEIIF